MSTPTVRTVRTLPNQKYVQPSWASCWDSRETAKRNPTSNPNLMEVVTGLHRLATKAWPKSRIYINHRVNFVTVKVDQPTIEDRALNVYELIDLDNYLDKHQLETVKTPKGIIYRVPR